MKKTLLYHIRRSIQPDRVLWTLIITASIVVFFWLRHFFPTEQIRIVVSNAGSAGPTVYILLSLIINIVAPFFAAPMVYVGYYLFGIDMIAYVTFSSFCNFFTNFWIARYFGQRVLRKMLGQQAMTTIHTLTRQHGYTTLFILRVFQGGVHDLISYAAGLTHMKFWPYLILSVAGLIPGAFLWYVIAIVYPSTVDFFLASSIASTGLSVIFIAGTVFLKRRRRHHV